MSNFERKFGKYAIPNLTMILIAFYLVGYLIETVNSSFFDFLTLDAYRMVFQGQVWRAITWLVIPPSDLSIFTIIMLIFYYSIGNTMEHTLGTYRYNVYLFLGMIMTVIAALLCLGLCLVFPQALLGVIHESSRASFLNQLEILTGAERWAFLTTQVIGPGFATYALCFSTYYINISIFLAFAVCYPEMQVYLMFVIPIKVKWLGILDLVLLGYSLLTGNIFTKFAVAAALINFAVFYCTYHHLGHLRPKQVIRRTQFKKGAEVGKMVAAKHKCAICGQTEESDPSLEFRFCSKCNGSYEYCSRHLYTHEHVK